MKGGNVLLDKITMSLKWGFGQNIIFLLHSIKNPSRLMTNQGKDFDEFEKKIFKKLLFKTND